MNIAIGKAIELLLVVGVVSAVYLHRRASLERARAAHRDDPASTDDRADEREDETPEKDRTPGL